VRFKIRVRRSGKVKAAKPTEVVDELRDIVTDAATEAIPRIRAQWPFKSGKSRAGFKVRPGSTNKIAIINRVAYSGHVRRKGGAPLLGQTLVPDVFQQEIHNGLEDRADDVAEKALGAIVAGIPTR
jgi:hypothetical protein